MQALLREGRCVILTHAKLSWLEASLQQRERRWGVWKSKDKGSGEGVTGRWGGSREGRNSPSFQLSAIILRSHENLSPSRLSMSLTFWAQWALFATFQESAVLTRKPAAFPTSKAKDSFTRVLVKKVRKAGYGTRQRVSEAIDGHFRSPIYLILKFVTEWRFNLNGHSSQRLYILIQLWPASPIVWFQKSVSVNNLDCLKV